MISEKQLLKRARAFDRKILAEIYDRYSPGLYRYAVRQLNDDIQAEECVSETFSRFLQILRGGGGPQEHLQAYLYRIARNWITDQFRRQPPLPLDPEFPVVAESSGNPPFAVEHILVRERVRRALMRLTPDQRQVILLKYMEGWSNAEVAAAVDKPIGAVKSLQHRALNALHRLLVDDHEKNDG
jgi:RNA polymerase sigma-70 factor (ECF subfamily)